MKFEADTELDRLLRRHARRKAMSASSTPEAAVGDDGADGSHLDADELNAYAEGALPASARARYMTHLADCDECRGLVTKLTLAANVATEASAQATPAATVPASRSWREWLAALFAPAVLRYAVPALVLLAVVAVAFIATRERRQADLVAQNEQQRANTTSTEQQHSDERASQTATANTAPPSLYDRSQNSNAPAIASTPAPPATTSAPAQERPKEEAATTTDTLAAQNEPKPADQPTLSGGVFGKQAETTTETAKAAKAQPPPAAPAPVMKSPAEEDKAGDIVTTQQRSDEGEKNKSAGPASIAGSSSIFNSVEDRAQSNSRGRAESGRRENPARKSRPASPQDTRDKAGSDDADESEAETRSAGGRQFRRQGGAWVDTAYNASRGAVNVARGSEQYRALVADEPGIGSIANQLGGTVIVVWKNRAYRIY